MTSSLSPTDVLREEHTIILRALDLVARAATEGASDAWWGEAVAWLRAFADVNHHAKEERSLFPAMEKAGVPSQGGPIGVMLAEHVQGREHIRAIAEGSGAVRASAARAYVTLLRAHIDKENHVLFQIADSVLDPQAVAGLRRDFEAVAGELGAPASLAGGAAAVDRLAASLGAR